MEENYPKYTGEERRALAEAIRDISNMNRFPSPPPLSTIKRSLLEMETKALISGTDLIQPSTKNFKNVKLKLFVIYSLSLILDKSDFHYLISVCGMILSRVKMISKNKYT